MLLERLPVHVAAGAPPKATQIEAQLQPQPVCLSWHAQKRGPAGIWPSQGGVAIQVAVAGSLLGELPTVLAGQPALKAAHGLAMKLLHVKQSGW